jgi:hydrogenase nickel incorporation protein HypA/HybF
MHEMGIISSVLDSATTAAHDAGAIKLLQVDLRIGEMTEAIEDALMFAFEALTDQDEFTRGAKLQVHMVQPKSICLECGEEFMHDRFHMFCPACDSFATELLCGRELEITSIEVDLPD